MTAKRSRATSAERRLHGQAAAFKRWAFEPDRTAATAAARRAFDDRFAREVDPDGVLAPEERAERAEALKRAHMADLSRRAAAARRRKRTKTA